MTPDGSKMNATPIRNRTYILLLGVALLGSISANIYLWQQRRLAEIDAADLRLAMKAQNVAIIVHSAATGMQIEAAMGNVQGSQRDFEKLTKMREEQSAMLDKALDELIALKKENASLRARAPAVIVRKQ